MENDSSIKWLKNLGNIRDGILLLLSIDYTLGYIVWAIIAWKNKLGPFPVLDGQYIVAGLPIFIAIIFTFIMAHVFRRFTFKLWPKFFNKLSYKFQIIIDLFTYVLDSLLTIFLFYIAFIEENADTKIISFFISLILAILLMLLRDPQYYSFSYFDRLFGKSIHSEDLKIIKQLGKNINKSIYQKIYLSILYPTLILFIGIFFFINTVYPNIPQVFGGAKTRFAVFDLEKNSLSDITLSQIVEKNSNEKDNNIVCSKKLAVFFSGNNYFLIGTKDSTESDYKILAISISTINAINWLVEDN